MLASHVTAGALDAADPMPAPGVRPAPRLVHFLLLPVLYYVCARVGVTLTVMPEGLAIIWLPNAVLLAFLLRFGTSGYSAFVALALAAEIAADVPTFSLGEAVLFGVANVVETTLAYALLTRRRADLRIDELGHLVRFLIAAPLIAALVGAAIGGLVYSTFRGEHTTYLEFVRIWWFGDALGLLILTPLLLARWRVEPGAGAPSDDAPTRRDMLVGVGALVVIALQVASQNGIVFGVHFGPVMLLPFVLYGAVRFGHAAAAAAVALVAFVVVVLSSWGFNPFGQATSRAAVVYAQEFLLVLSLTALGLAALVRELRARQHAVETSNAELRDRSLALAASNRCLQTAEAEVVALNAGLEARVRERTRELQDAMSRVKRLEGLIPICAWCKKVRDDREYWHEIEHYLVQHTDADFSHGICPDCEKALDEPSVGRW